MCEAVTINDEFWEELIELTGGAAAVCYQCGACTASCPWSLVRDKAISVRGLIRQAQLGLPEGDAALWLCTTCAQCETTCPRGVAIADVMRGLRYLVWEQRRVPPGLPALLWSVFWNSNPWTQPPSQRSHWAKDLGVPLFDPARHETLLYVGCTSSYDGRAQQVARALVQVLNAADVAYGFLGDDEPCCGEAALSVGHKPYFQEIAQQTAGVFADRGVTQLLTISPHCYDAFKNHYPPAGQVSFVPQHYTQYLAELANNGRLAFHSIPQSTVTFHDPCYLARHNKETTASRRVLGLIPGVELVEMDHSGTDTLCCGGGGGRMWLETEPGERFADIRVGEAKAAGAGMLATACPFCISCLDDSLKANGIEDLAVMDVAEIAALAVSGA